MGRLPYLPPLHQLPGACHSSTTQRLCVGGLPGISTPGSKAHIMADSRLSAVSVEALGHRTCSKHSWRHAGVVPKALAQTESLHRSALSPRGPLEVCFKIVARQAVRAQASSSASSGSTNQVPRLVKPSRQGGRLSRDDAAGQPTQRKVPPSISAPPSMAISSCNPVQSLRAITR